MIVKPFASHGRPQRIIASGACVSRSARPSVLSGAAGSFLKSKVKRVSLCGIDDPFGAAVAGLFEAAASCTCADLA